MQSHGSGETINQGWKMFDNAINGLEKIINETTRGFYNLEQGLKNGWRL